MSRPFRLPWLLVALDGFGAILLVLGVTGAVGVDIGMPALNRLWPFLLALGALLMAPLIVWVLREALRTRQRSHGRGP